MSNDPKPMHPLLLEAILMALLGCIALAVACLVMRGGADGAPAPMARPAKVKAFDPRSPAGDYTMTWAGSDWRLTLSRGGNYEARAGDSVWVGNWHVDGEGRLWVSESSLDDAGVPGDPRTWGVKWDVDLRGRVDAESPSGSVRYPDGSHRTTIRLKRAK